MRMELLKALNRHFEIEISKSEAPSEVIKNFEYLTTKKELIIEGIFVRNYNADIYFKPKNISAFVSGLVARI